MTINAARALGLAHEVGSIEAGKAADLCVWRVGELSELGYWIGMPGPERRIFGGGVMPYSDRRAKPSRARGLCLTTIAMAMLLLRSCIIAIHHWRLIFQPSSQRSSDRSLRLKH